jgi:hypothetical protein
VTIPAAAARDDDIYRIGYLALLAAPMLLNSQALAVAVYALWGLVAVVAVCWRQAGPVAAVALPALAYAILVALAVGGLAWAGAALAPVALLLLAALLPRAETAPAARDWGLAVMAVAWGSAGALALIGLQTIPAPLGSAGVAVVGALLGYAAGRRAAAAQGLRQRVAVGVGATFAVGGVVTLAAREYSVATVVAVILGLFLASVAPEPPRPAQGGLAAVVEVQQMLVYVAPLSFAILWLLHTFFFQSP